jgi:hypothetical protein
MKQPLAAAANLEALDLLGKATVDSLHDARRHLRRREPDGPRLRAYLRAIDADAQQPLARPLRAAETMTARGALAETKQITTRIREVWSAAWRRADRRRLLRSRPRLGMAEGGGDAETARILGGNRRARPARRQRRCSSSASITRGQGEPDRAILDFERAESIEAFEVNARIRHAQVLVGMGGTPTRCRCCAARRRSSRATTSRAHLDQVDRIAKAAA